MVTRKAFECTQVRPDGKTERFFFVPVPSHHGHYMIVPMCVVEFSCPRCGAQKLVPCRNGKGLARYVARPHTERRLIGRGRYSRDRQGVTPG